MDDDEGVKEIRIVTATTRYFMPDMWKQMKIEENYTELLNQVGIPIPFTTRQAIKILWKNLPKECFDKMKSVTTPLQVEAAAQLDHYDSSASISDSSSLPSPPPQRVAVYKLLKRKRTHLEDEEGKRIEDWTEGLPAKRMKI